jgi:hypothetical protein
MSLCRPALRSGTIPLRLPALSRPPPLSDAEAEARPAKPHTESRLMLHRLLRRRRSLELATIATLATFSFMPAALADGSSRSEWIAADATPADWFDATNWTHGVPGDSTYATIDHDGVAVINGDAQAQSIGIGSVGEGRLRIRGGTTQVNWSMFLGSELNSRGVLNVDDGALNIMGNLHAGAANGEGVIRQSGGAIDVINLELGGNWVYSLFLPTIDEPEDHGRGRYLMSGGGLHAFNAGVGNSGIGNFRQDGGRVEVERTLHIGGLIESYELIAQPVLRQTIVLAPIKQAQDSAAPAHAIPDISHLDVWSPPLVPSRGRYRLESGELVGGDLIVDNTGVYRQSGGTATVDFAATRMNGRLALRSGSFHAAAGLRSELTLDLAGQNVDLSVGAGILDLTTGVVGGQNSHVAAGPDSLTIVHDSFNPNAAFATFNRQGLLHVAGNDLNLPVNKRIAGAGVLSDYVDARGTVAAAADHGINLSSGLRLRDSASVDLGTGGLAARGRATVLEGGALSASQIVVGGKLNAPWEHQFQRHGYVIPREPTLSTESGTIRQSAGDVDVASHVSVLNGVYRMSGGTIDAEFIDVGVNQFGPTNAEPVEARFVQTGGVVRTSQLVLSQTYLYAHLLDYDASLRRVNQTDVIAAADANDLKFAVASPALGPIALDSTYRLEGGQLIADSIALDGSINPANSTRFIQTGGSVDVTHGFSVYGSTTSYVIDGGSMKTWRLVVGNEYILPYSQYPEYVPSDSATFAIRSADADITIAGQLTLGGGSHFRAVPGATIRMVNPEPIVHGWPVFSSSLFHNVSISSDDLAGLSNLTLLFDSQTSEASTFEVAGADLGDVPAGFAHNFALGSLIVGGDDAAWVRLIDQIDNQRDGFLSEALYVDTLVVAAGSTLDLGGFNLYYRHAMIEGTVIAENGAAMRLAVPEPATLALILVAIIAAIRRPILHEIGDLAAS